MNAEQRDDIQHRSNLTRTQFLIWMGQKLNPDAPLYNMILTFTIGGDIEVAAFQQGFQQVVARNDALRSVIEEIDGVPQRRVRPHLSYQMSMLDFSDEADPQDALQSWLDKQRVLSFDPAVQLFDSSLIKIGKDRFVWYLNQHHLITDGWSVALVYQRMAVCYGLALEHRLPELPVWPDFETYASDMKQSEGRSADTYPPTQTDHIADLPSCYGESVQTKTTRSSRLFCDLGDKRSKRLKALTQEKDLRALSVDLALFNIFMTLLFSYLHRITGSSNLGVSAPAHNRAKQVLKDTVGVFIELFPLHIDLDSDETFGTLHQKIVRESLQFIRFARPGASDAESNRSCRAMLNLITASFSDFNGLPMQSRWQHSGHMDSHHVLRLHVHDFDATGRFMLLFDFNEDVFSKTQQHRAVQHFLHLIDAFIEDRSQPLTRIDLLTDEERQATLYTFNQTETASLPDEMLMDRFEQQARQTPDAPAVLFEQQQLTYRDLDMRANRLAHYLQKQGIGPGEPVGVFMARSLEMVVGLYGILKAGGVYVPLDPDYPSARISFMLTDTKATVVLTQGLLADRLPDIEARLLRLDDEWPLIASLNPERPAQVATADSPAYIIYTSGSTGRPKGVINNHRGLCNRLNWGQETFGLTPADRVMQKTPFSFDVSLWEFFWPLQTGGCLVVARPGGHRDSSYLIRLIVEQAITIIHFVPSMLQAFLEDSEIPLCRSLKKVFCSGEALTWDLQQQFFDRLDAELHNLYGPTEASVEVAHWACSRTADDGVVPIGYPIANTRLYILDTELNPVLQGMPGELHIGGTPVTSGYLNQPALTAEHFIPDPFSRNPSDRLYKTGDAARHRPDGAIEYLGRLDDQVKIRGFRIEPGEIESVIKQHAAVRHTAVIAHESAGESARLAAYLVLDTSLETNGAGRNVSKQSLIEEIETIVKSQLPDYMTPSAFVMIPEMPLNAAGKLDRGALPLPEQWRGSEARYQAPRTDNEQILTTIWATVLRVEQVGVFDDFFALGGDSIRMIQVIAWAGQSGLHLTAQQFFRHPTLAELAVVAESSAKPAEQGTVTGAVPLSPIQHWFFEQDRPSFNHWNQAMMLVVPKPINIEWLNEAVQYIIKHHDVLRLRFVHHETGWEAHQTGEGALHTDGIVEAFDLSDHTGTDWEKAIETTISEKQTSLHISDGPLIRVTYFTLKPGVPDRLFINIHHLAVDGVSWSILLEDIETAYRLRTEGRAITLPPKTASFKRWSEQLTQYARTDKLRREAAYWQEAGKVPVGSLPADAESADNLENDAQTLSVVLDETETRKLLRDVPKAYRSKTDDLLLTALLLTLTDWTDARAMRIAIEKHGRETIGEDFDLSRTVGWFTALFPLTLALPESNDLGTVLKAVIEQLRRIPGGGVGYGVLRYMNDDAAFVQTMNKLPRAEVLFNYLGQLGQPSGPDSLLQASGALMLSHDADSERRYLLEINGFVIDEQLRIDWTYNQHLFQRASITYLADQYMEKLKGLMAHCMSSHPGDPTPADFPLAGLNERKLEQLAGALNRLDNTRKASS